MGRYGTYPAAGVAAGDELLIKASDGTGTKRVTASGLVAGGGTGGARLAPWDSSITYIQNDIVNRLGLIYVLIPATSLNEAPESNPDVWRLYDPSIKGTLADSASTTLPVSGVAGFGHIMAGDNVYFALFSFDASAAVSIITSYGAIATTDTAANLCIYTDTGDVAIKNNTGGSLDYVLKVTYNG